MPNIFHDLLNSHKNKSAQASQHQKQKEDTFLATLSSGKTHADEARAIVQILLYTLTAFVVYLGYNYYQDTFLEMFPPWIAYAFAIALPLTVELAKIKLSTLAMRSILFGWIKESWPEFFFWFAIVGLSIGGFVWSYSISTGGIKEVAREKSEIKNELPPLENILAVATRDIDGQISDLTQSNTRAGSMKTKRGNATWASQSIQNNNSAALSSLQNQRAGIIAEKTAWYKSQESKVVVKVGRWAGFIERFGGWGEWGTLVCVIAIGFFEALLRNVNKNNLPNAPQPNPTPTHGNGASIQNLTGSQNGKPSIFNQSPSPTLPQNAGIGFKWPGYGQTSKTPMEASPQQDGPMPQLPQQQSALTPSPQQAGPMAQLPQQPKGVLGCDQILLTLQSKLQSDLPNLRPDRHGRKATVSARINKAFDECFAAMSHIDFQPTRFTGAKVYGYLSSTVIPALNGAGYPYQNDTVFLKRLLDVLPKEERYPVG